MVSGGCRSVVNGGRWWLAMVVGRWSMEGYGGYQWLYVDG